MAEAPIAKSGMRQKTCKIDVAFAGTKQKHVRRISVR